MTDTPTEIEAARALVAAYDALNSDEHAAEAERLRQLSQSVSARVDAYNEAQAKLQSLHTRSVEQGQAKPAANIEAAKLFATDEEADIDPFVRAIPSDEYSDSRANGAHTGD